MNRIKFQKVTSDRVGFRKLFLNLLESNEEHISNIGRYYCNKKHLKWEMEVK